MVNISELANLSVGQQAFLGGLGGGAIAAIISAFFLLFLIIIAAVYVYTSFAYMAIARKTKYPSPGIAWIPIVGPLLITSRAAKMHWWPILLLIVFFIPILGSIAAVVFTVFSVIWLWKTFEAVKRPGWWAILSLIPVVNLVLLGVAAWSK